MNQDRRDLLKATAALPLLPVVGVLAVEEEEAIMPPIVVAPFIKQRLIATFNKMARGEDVNMKVPKYEPLQWPTPEQAAAETKQMIEEQRKLMWERVREDEKSEAKQQEWKNAAEINATYVKMEHAREKWPDQMIDLCEVNRREEREQKIKALDVPEDIKETILMGWENEYKRQEQLRRQREERDKVLHTHWESQICDPTYTHDSPVTLHACYQ